MMTIYHHCNDPEEKEVWLSLWKSKINDLVTVIEDGGDRVQGIILDTDICRLCIVCVYMPCRGKGHNPAEYSAVLDEVYEIITTVHLYGVAT
jgi:hypothetical protein